MTKRKLLKEFKKLNSENILLCKDINELKDLLATSNFIIEKNKDHSHVDSLLKGLLLEHNQYSSSLKNPKLSLEEKQQVLNDLHLSFEKDLNSVQFYIPKSLSSWIFFIDQISKIKDVNLLKHSHLTYLWNKLQGIHSVEPVIYSARNTEKSTFLKKLIFIFRISNYLNHSVGLMLAHCISKSTFKAITKSDRFGQTSFHVSKTGHRILNKLDLKKDTSFEIEKIALLSSTSKNFLSQIPSLFKLAKNKLSLKVNSKGLDSLSADEKDLFNLLEDKLNLWVITDEDRALFCEQLGVYFEFQTELFHCVLKPIPKSLKHTNVYVLSADFISGLFVLGRESFQLPHLLPLDNWVHNNKNPSSINTLSYNDPNSFTIHSGGPNHLSSPMVSAFIQSRHNSFAFAKQIDLEALNYMKNQSFKVNKDFLNFILSRISVFLLVFLYKIHPDADRSKYLAHEKLREEHLLNYGVLNFINSSTCVLRTLNEFLNLDPKLKELFLRESKELEGSPEKELLLERIYFLKQQLTKNYYDALILIRTFFHTLFTASSFSDLSFFFNVNIDFRGRFYYLAFPLGIQNSNFGSSLFELNFSHPPSALSDKRLLDVYLSGLKPLKDYFTFIKFQAKMNTPVIGLDVTCSGLQIISALIGFEKGLLLTNFVHESSTEDIKLDLYGDIQNIFLKTIPLSLTANEINIKEDENQESTEYDAKDSTSSSSKEDEFYKRTTDRMSKLNVDNTQFIKVNLIEFISKNPNAIKNILMAFKNIFTRNVIKYWAMRLVYSEGSRSRAIELMSFYNEQIKNFPFAPRKLIFKIAMFLSELFKVVMFSHYTGFGDFVNFCQLHVVSSKMLQTNKGVWLTCSNNHLEVFFTQFKSESKKYYHNDRNNNIVSFSYNSKSENINYAGHSRSLLPNFIHFLDSRLMTLIVLKSKENNIPIYCNHDCFYVPIHFGEKIKSIYFSCFKELFFNTDCLTSFFESNCVSSSIYAPFVSQINEKKNIILSKINSEKLKPSFFVLS